jgi:hypothetical protein
VKNGVAAFLVQSVRELSVFSPQFMQPNSDGHSMCPHSSVSPPRIGGF